MADEVKSRRIIDVSSPDETAPHTSARPVIVGHKPTVQDPMVSAPAPDSANPSPTHDNTPVVRENTQPEPLPSAQKSMGGDNLQRVEEGPAEPEQPGIQPSHIKQLVHDKTYFSPVSQPPRRQGISWLLVLTFLAILGGAGYALLIL